MDDLKTMKILVAELLDEGAIEYMRDYAQVDVMYKMSREELLQIIPDYSAIVIRSETVIDEEFLEAATKLRIVVRAGSGLDNVDIPLATQKGVIVANTPESNIISAAEHTFALLLSSTRNVVWANNFIKSGQWDRKRFEGSELYSKTLGIIGLGRIGSLVSVRAKGFGMRVIAYDPYITDERFQRFGVEKKNTIEDLVRESDYITIHTPKTKETINIIGEREIALMKDGVRLVNCARGGLYNEEALRRGLKSGKIASVGIDVWSKEPQESHPLYEFENVVGTPHLGASTVEATLRVGQETASEVIAGLKGEIVKNAVNIPSISESTFAKLRAFIDLAGKMGRFYGQVRHGRGVERVEIEFAGKEVDQKEDVAVLSLVALKGMLESTAPETVNFVNVGVIAEHRGIDVRERISLETYDYSNLIKLQVTEEGGDLFEIFGTVLEHKYPRIVQIGEYDMDIVPEGKLLYCPHKNVPGVIGKVGLACAEYNVNISRMFVANGRTDSTMILKVDNNVPDVLVEKLKQFDEIYDVAVVNLS